MVVVEEMDDVWRFSSTELILVRCDVLLPLPLRLLLPTLAVTSGLKTLSCVNILVCVTLPVT